MNYFITVSEARRLIEAERYLTQPSFKPLIKSLGHYTAEAIVAPVAVPSFDNSAMDGYGFRYADLADNTPLTVTQVIAAGQLPTDFHLGKGEAVRIFTGAKVPEGVDTVVIQEKVTLEGDLIHFNREEVKQGDNIRLKGSQTEIGTTILPAHTLITPQVIGFLAGFGIPTICVYHKLKIGVLVTGDELLDLGEPLVEGKIYNSNAYTLHAELTALGQHLQRITMVNDTKEATLNAIEKALAEVDVLLLTGGISVGDYDYVRGALQEAGVTEIFYKIKQKPGKPLYFGKRGDKYVFAMPGNPASVFTCFHIYVKPFLLALTGAQDSFHEQTEATLLSPIKKKGKELTVFFKAVQTPQGVKPLEGQESYRMDSVAKANCLIEFPAEKDFLPQSETVKIYQL